MSEQTVSTSTSRPSGGVGGAFRNKIGPLPLWGWMLIGIGLAVAYSYYKKSKGTNTGSSTSSSQEAAGQAAGGVDSSLVPQFINQEYVNTTPPPAPNITVNNQVPPPSVTVPPMTPPPATSPTPTVSGAPGSYTTNLPGGLNEWTSTGKYSLNTIAKSHGMTSQQLIASSEGAENNPLLKSYVQKGNYNAPLPAGVQVFIPNANWSMKK